MKTIKLVLLLMLAVALVAVVIQNTATIQVRFLWPTGEVSGILLLFLTAAGGVSQGYLLRSSCGVARNDTPRK